MKADEGDGEDLVRGKSEPACWFNVNLALKRE